MISAWLLSFFQIFAVDSGKVSECDSVPRMDGMHDTFSLVLLVNMVILEGVLVPSVTEV